MTNQELADAILRKFMPYAFTCDCKGADPDCAEMLNSASLWAQRDTVERVARFVREQVQG